MKIDFINSSVMWRLFFTHLLFLVSIGSSIGQGVNFPNGKKLFEDRFENALNTELWKAEYTPGPHSSVENKDGKLVIDTQGGVTVWFNKELTGNIAIEYECRVVVDGGRNDRLSDLNQFWMATDPRNENLFTRTGRFDTYDSLRLYYVGMGGNGNKTTRFRKYPGNGERDLSQEYLDAAHLLVANHTYKIRILVHNGTTSFWVDGKCFFTFDDKSPLQRGYFAFRSTNSRHEVDNFVVSKLK